MSIVQLSFSKLLEEICQKMGVGTPNCVATIGAEGWFIAYIDLPIARSGAIVEIARARVLRPLIFFWRRMIRLAWLSSE